MSLLSSSKWIVLTFPLAAKNCGGGGGGGGSNPSPSGLTWDWVGLKAQALVPGGLADALHHLPVIGWLI